MKSPLNIFPSSDKNPYYIVTHPYTRTSAGIRCLHLLCHHINLHKIPAYIILIGEENNLKENTTEPDYLTPILTQRSARYHFEKGMTPITVYPEIVAGNPYASPCTVRYILNFPGLLGGDEQYNAEELCFSYSKTLAEKTSYPGNILFIPTIDTRIFHASENHNSRSGSCFYASKYKREHNGNLYEVTNNSIEITSLLPNSQSPAEIAELFRKSELFYTYENTALAIEATLCGCPAVFLPNPHLKSIIASDELGRDGVAWGDSPVEIARAKATVELSLKNYEQSIFNFHENLSKFIEKTQKHVTSKAYTAEQYLRLTHNLAGSNGVDEIQGELGIKDRNYAPLLGKLPWWIERTIGAWMCSVGLMNDGEFLWNRAQKRSRG
jgi:hypothetical protein